MPASGRRKRASDLARASGDRGLWTGIAIGLGTSALLVFLSPLIAHYGEVFLETASPRKAVLRFDLMHSDREKNSMTLSVTNDGDKAAVIKRVEFCNPLGIVWRRDQQSRAIWHKRLNRYDEALASEMYEELQDESPGAEGELSCPGRGEQLLKIDSTRLVSAGDSVELRVSHPEGFSEMISTFQTKSALGPIYICLVTFIIREEKFGGHRLIPCMPEHPEDFEERWAIAAQGLKRDESLPAPTIRKLEPLPPE